jgi:PKD repeat protein
VNFAWDMGDGTQFNAITVQHTYQIPGQFNVVLVVTDDQGLESAANHAIQVVEAGVPPEPTVPPAPTEEPPEPEQPIEPPEPEQPVEPPPEAEQPIEPPPEEQEESPDAEQDETTEGD